MTTLLVVSVVLLLISSGLTSMTEAALFSVPLTRVHVAVGEGRRGSARLLRIKESIQRPVSALVVLNNTINIAGSILVGQIAERVFGSVWMGLFSACLTFLVILFAEIIPKTVGERFSEPIALRAAPILLFVTAALLPLIWLIEHVTLHFASKTSTNAASEEEIEVLARVGSSTGTLTHDEGEIIPRVFRLNDVTAKDLMTHRLKLFSLPPDKELQELKPEELYQQYSRILVAENGDIDQITGVVYRWDLLASLAQGKGHLTVGDLRHEIERVPEGEPAHRLLRRFQRTRQHISVVLDEYGGTSGVVTLEDVLEELVGEIEDEREAVESSSRETPASEAEAQAETQAQSQAESQAESRRLSAAPSPLMGRET